MSSINNNINKNVYTKEEVKQLLIDFANELKKDYVLVERKLLENLLNGENQNDR